jgi:hypothetical protein
MPTISRLTEEIERVRDVYPLLAGVPLALGQETSALLSSAIMDFLIAYGYRQSRRRSYDGEEY